MDQNAGVCDQTDCKCDTLHVPMVSVITTVYNGEAYVVQALESVILQTFGDWEIVCVDDGSTDGSLAILKEYKQALGDKMQLIEQENAGVAKATNRAIDCARGKYLAFLDSDDYFDPRCFELAVSKAEATNAQIVAWDIWFFNDAHQRCQHPPMGILYFAPYLQEPEPFSWRRSPDDILMSFSTWTWNKLYLREFINENGFRYQENVGKSQDVMFAAPALVKADRIATVVERLISYRVMRDGSEMTRKDRHPLDFIEVICTLKRYLESEDLLQPIFRSYATWAVSSALYNMNTLASFEAFSAVFERLSTTGFEEMGVAACKKEDFLNPVFYDRMHAILDGTMDTYLFSRVKYLDWQRENVSALLDFTSVDRDLARRERDQALSELESMTVVEVLRRKRELHK